MTFEPVSPLPAIPSRFKNETALREFCIKYAGKFTVEGYLFKSPGRTGVPDVIFVNPFGFTFFVEFKHPNGDGVLSERQKTEIAILESQSAAVYVCEDVFHFIAVLDVNRRRRSSC